MNHRSIPCPPKLSLSQRTGWQEARSIGMSQSQSQSLIQMNQRLSRSQACITLWTKRFPTSQILNRLHHRHNESTSVMEATPRIQPLT